jgi:hypothetical protein
MTKVRRFSNLNVKSAALEQRRKSLDKKWGGAGIAESDEGIQLVSSNFSFES